MNADFNLSERFGRDLSSRRSAVTARQEVLRVLSTGKKPVVVDCTGLRTLSESFADELFGVLVATYGRGWFKENIQVIGLTKWTRASLLRAVEERLRWQSERAKPVPSATD